MTPETLASEIERWQRIVNQNIHGPNHRTGKERLSAHLGSWFLGRNFNESGEEYLKRTGRVELYAELLKLTK